MQRIQTRGFTLTELLVTIAIVAIVSAIALPLYSNYGLRTYRAQVQSDLLNCSQSLERFSAINFTYAGTADTDDDGLADGNDDEIGDDICSALSTPERYTMTIVNATGTSFTLTATPVANSVMDGDGAFTLDDAGNRTYAGAAGWHTD